MQAQGSNWVSLNLSPNSYYSCSEKLKSELMHNISKGKGLSISNALCRSLRKCQTLKRIRLKYQSHENICIVALCLKITEKVSFNIASEASYVYILNGQKLIKNAKNGPFWRVFENLKLAVKQCYQTGQF